jgi:hypothetical protein
MDINDFAIIMTRLMDGLTGKKEKPSLPYSYAFIRWNEWGKRYMCGGDEGKTIEVYERGKVKERFAYSENRVEILTEKRRIAVFDFTHGQPTPKIEAIKEYDPSTIEIR